MRFRETIEQHFRRALVSKPFRSRRRGSSHETGAGAIVARAIDIASTEMRKRARAITLTSRRRRGDRARLDLEMPSTAKKVSACARRAIPPRPPSRGMDERREAGRTSVAGRRRFA
jgi:hypothetical protein